MNGEAIARFRRRQRRRPFLARFVRLETDPGNPVRLDSLVAVPLDGEGLEARAPIPPWLDLVGDPRAPGSLVEARFLALAADGEGHLRLRCATSRAEATPWIEAELLAPHETTVRWLPPEGGQGVVVRHLGFTELPRAHAKALKHVYGFGFQPGEGLFLTVVDERGARALRSAPLDVRALCKHGCRLAEALAEGCLHAQADYYQHCRDCPPAVQLAVDPLLRAGREVLARVTRDAVERAFDPQTRPGAIGWVPRRRLALADDRGVFHVARLRPRTRRQARRGRGEQRAEARGTTTFICGRSRDGAGSYAMGQRLADALARVSRTVREGGARASLLRRLQDPPP